MFQPRKNGMCKNCHRPVTLPNGQLWRHTEDGTVYCNPLNPEDKGVAFPDKTRVSQRPNVKHLFVGGDRRSACGILLIENEDELEEHSRTAAGTTCLRCPNTLKYQKLAEQEKESAMSDDNLPEMRDICANCNEQIHKFGLEGVWRHEGTSQLFCHALETKAEPTFSRISGTYPPRTSTDPTQQTLMNNHPDKCTAIYRDAAGFKVYCDKPRDHTGSCDPNEKPDPATHQHEQWQLRRTDDGTLYCAACSWHEEPKKAQRRPVYCVHCQQYHSPDDAHKVSFDYPPIPYARELFESRQADLHSEMQEYIEGRLNRAELAAVIERIETEYVQGMHDLFALRLI